MKRYTMIFLIFMVVTILLAENINDRFEKRYQNRKSGSTEFVGGNVTENRSVPNLIDYQGRFTDSNDVPITSSVSISFAIYNVATGGSNLWDETHTSVTPTDGLVHVLLGSVDSFGTSLFNGSDRWLGINVNGDGEMTPRLRIVSVPYAIFANDSDNLDGYSSESFVNSTGDTMTGTLDVNITGASSHAIGGTKTGSEGYLASDISGVYGYSDNSGPVGSVAVYGVAEANDGNNFAIRAEATGIGVDSNFGIYSSAANANNNWAGYFIGDVYVNGNFHATGLTKDSSGDAGTNGQVLSSIGTGTDWIDAVSSGATEIDDLTDAHSSSSNVCLGSGTSSGGSNNTLLGIDTGTAITNGLANTFIGRAAGYTNTSGNYNTYLGYYAGLNSTGSSNVFLGGWSGFNEVGSNKLYIENSTTATPLIYGEFDNDKIVINGEFQATGITRDSGGDAGTNGQVLSSTGSGTNWITSASGDGHSLDAADGSPADVVYVDNDGDVGIGVGTTASSKLDVDGDINISTGNSYKINDVNILHNTGSNSNISLGELAGSSLGGSSAGNTIIGYKSGRFTSTGSANVYIGMLAGEQNSSGNSNVFIGDYAGYNKTSGTGNILLGHLSGGTSSSISNSLMIDNSNTDSPLIHGNFTDGSEIVIINGDFRATGEIKDSNGDVGSNGQVLSSTGSATNWIDTGDIASVNAGSGLTGGGASGSVTLNVDFSGTGSASTVARGDHSHELNDFTDAITDTTSVFLGAGTGINDDGSANRNSAYGVDVLKINSSGYYNDSFGYQSLYSNTTGHENCAFGFRALYKNTNSNNTAIGNESFYNNNSGNSNTGLGYRVQMYNTSGSHNVTIGVLANCNNQTGHFNTIIGSRAGFGSSGISFDGNILIGYQAGYNETESDKLYIENSDSADPLIGGDFSTDKVTINDVLILAPRTSAPTSPTEGEIYVNSSNHHIYCYLNGSWKQLDN